MIPLIAGIFILGAGGGPATVRGTLLILLVAGAGVLAAACWGAVEDWIDYNRGRKWPTVAAVVDVVSVAMVESKGISSTASHWWPYYLATLTYSYRNPEPQTGEYKRRFGSEDDAKAWANSYKGETLKVHVDPRDPTRSVLRKEDL
jgi:hypothetical protein